MNETLVKKNGYDHKFQSHLYPSIEKISLK